MTDLAKLVVKLEAQTAQYQASLEKANKQLDRFSKSADLSASKIGKGIAVAATVAATALVLLTKSAIDNADNLRDLSMSSGIAVEQLSALSYAAKFSGVETAELANGLKKLNVNISDAAGNAKGEAAKAFTAMGVAVKDANGKVKDAGTVLGDIAEKFQNYENGANKTALAVKIFGKAGADLIPFLNEGKTGIAELTAEAERLGVVISGETADAADEFNDKLTKLKSGLIGGLGQQVAAQLLPTLNKLADSFLKGAEGAQAMAEIASVVATGIKLIGTVAVITSDVFNKLGKLLGAVGAQIVALLTGHFAEAVAIQEAFKADIAEGSQKTVDRLTAIWGEGGDKAVKNWAKAAGRAAKDVKVEAPNMEPGKTATIELISVKDLSIQTSAMEKFYDTLNTLTMTNAERQVEQFERVKVALLELEDQHKISAETFAARYSEAVDEILPQFDLLEIAAKKIGSVEAVTKKMTEFEKEAARNTQNIIADTILGGFEDGFWGVTKRFGDMLLQLAVQAQAAKIAEKIFGSETSGGGGSGFLGMLGKLFSATVGGGSKDSGGRGKKGQRVTIGIGAQPETFVPDSNGTFYPAGAGGGMTVNQYFSVAAPSGAISRQTETQIGAAAARGLGSANRRNN